LFDEPCQRRLREGIRLERTPHGTFAYFVPDDVA
jgi:hypothetical protein